MAFMRKAETRMGSRTLEWYEMEYKKAFPRSKDPSADEGKEDEGKPVCPMSVRVLQTNRFSPSRLNFSPGTQARILFGNCDASRRFNLLQGHRTKADSISADNRGVQDETEADHEPPP